MQTGLVWSRFDSVTLPPKNSGHTLHYRDPGDILTLLADAVGPPTGVCVVGDIIAGAAGWAQIPLARQYHAVTREAAGFVAGAMNYLRISGPDAWRVLDMLTPRDMSKLAVGRGMYVLFTTPAGTVDHEAVVLRMAEDEFVFSCGGPNTGPSWLPDALTAHPSANAEETEIGSFNLKGPKRLEMMDELVHPDDRAKIHKLRVFEACPARTLEGIPVWILRTTIGVEMWGADEALRQSWVRILRRPELITPCGWDLLDVFRLECQEMVFGVYPIDQHSGTTLWEAGFGWMAGRAKQRDFIGRTALRLTRESRRLWLAGLAANQPVTDLPYLGHEVFAPTGEFAGYVTTSAFSPRHRRCLAFAHLKPWCHPGQPLLVGDHSWTVAALPFTELDIPDASGDNDGQPHQCCTV